MSIILAPSVLSADFGNLQRDIEMMNRSQADWIHVDIMDGRFVPNISFGFPVMEALKKYARKPLDVHLMIVEPEKYIERFVEAGAAVLTVHYETCPHLNRTIQQIRETGIKAGVSLNPHTPVSLLQHVLPYLDLVLIMSVNPGFGAQKFIPETHQKLQQLRQMIAEQDAQVLVEVDGGVSLKNVAALAADGANVFVAGNAIFSTDNPEETIAEFKKTIPGREAMI